MAMVALIAPGIGNLSDRRGWRLRLLTLSCLLGSFATCGLFFAGPGQYWLAAILFILGNIGFAAGNIFYNAYLPDLASGHEADRLSARGFALGYIGGGLMLLIVFMMIQQHELLGLPDKGAATRLGFLLTGAWWLGFALPAFAWLKVRARHNGATHALKTPRDYLKTLTELRNYRDLSRFLVAFLIYNDGIQTIIAVSAIFARDEFGLDTGTILGCFLMIQFVAMPGALLFSRLAGRFNTKRAVLLSLVLFTLIAGYASIMSTAPRVLAARLRGRNRPRRQPGSQSFTLFQPGAETEECRVLRLLRCQFQIRFDLWASHFRTPDRDDRFQSNRHPGAGRLFCSRDYFADGGGC